MSYFFLELLKLSISASFLIIAVILLRLLMRKSPKSIYCILWALVGIRLICPFSFESVFSVIPKEEAIPINAILTIPMTDTHVKINTTTTANLTQDKAFFESENSFATNNSFNLVDILSSVWITGTITIMLYGIISYIRLKRIVSVSINDKENIYLCDNIDVPFIFGIFKPKIYLPSNMAENQKEFVLLHEKAHLSRHDNLWKPVGFMLLSIYWFNPLVWIAYHLFSKDIELATDEKVINNLNSNEIKRYSETLLSCSLVKSNLMIKICPVAFGEVGVKDRIKAVLSYKKPSFWIILITVISCIIVGVCFLTKPKDNKLTISKVKELVSKGDNLTLGDFEQYEGTDIGSGLYILRYDVEPNHYLLIYPTSSKKDFKILNAYFVPDKNFDEKVNAFTQDIEEYLEKNDDSLSNNSIMLTTYALTTYETEEKISYSLSNSDSNILKNIISNGNWNRETCDGLPEYTFEIDNRKYGLEVFSSQIHITDMNGWGKGEIVCTGEDFEQLKNIVEKIKPRNQDIQNSELSGLNLENLQYSVKAQTLLPFADDPEVYKELERISKEDFSIYEEIWSKLPDNIVTFNDNIFDTKIKNAGHYYEKIDENNTNYHRTITNEQAIKIIRNKYRGALSDNFDEFEVKSQFVLFTDLYQDINREPVILVTVQGTFKTAEETKKSAKEYWKEKIGSDIIDNMNLDTSSQLYAYLLDPNNGQEFEYDGHFEMNHINFSNN